ncbi:MAG: nucleoside triphosphate pyrophosphohydrolase [Desulfamplus sp.]|nr:nucleoside triphosphate pyrophosphohydrolase [Desulfamplus sp.]
MKRLARIVGTLRGDDGCPWDRKQTPISMWKCLAEEVYELLGAIEDDDPGEICDELGDVLFQLVFIAEIYRERGAFDLDRVLEMSAAKMIRRHPHVYADTSVKNEEELWNRWEGIKKEEKKKSGKECNLSILDSVPRTMPALMRACKISERAVRAGFDWKDIHEVMAKASEEWNEFSRAMENGTREEAAMELGDVLFTLANVARTAGIHPEAALAGATGKFERRFKYMEAALGRRGCSLKDVPRQELEQLWSEAKEHDFNS